MGPYSLLSVGQTASTNPLGYTINPSQLNSSGILPGLTNISVAGSITLVQQSTGAPLIKLGTLQNGTTVLQFLNASTKSVEFQASANAAGQVTWDWYDSNSNIVMMVGWLPVAQVYGWAVATPGNSLAGQV